MKQEKVKKVGSFDLDTSLFSTLPVLGSIQGGVGGLNKEPEDAAEGVKHERPEEDAGGSACAVHVKAEAKIEPDR
jgi:hypothetical protein